jgi:uncharacterized membrane protein YjfL (UPF0719 family)
MTLAFPLLAAGSNLVDKISAPVVSALVFTLLGIVLFAVAFLAMTKLAPFSIRKEIEDQQNRALGIVIAAVIIGIALIISSAI